MMKQHTAAKQHYWHHPSLPFLELRETENSTKAYKAHIHQTLSIGAVTAGMTRMCVAGQVETVTRGDLVLIEPECVHSCNPVNEEPRSYLMLFVDYSWFVNQVSHLFQGKITSIRFQQAKINQPDLFELYLTFVAYFKAGNLELAQACLIELVEQVTRSYAKQEERQSSEPLFPQQIKQALSQDLEAPPSLVSLAKSHQICRETLIRSFKKQTGISPKAYLNNIRIEKAKQLLNKGCSLSEASYQLGFADQSHFQKTFLHYTASTPRQYQGKKSLFDKK